jgi:hypothetical protein
MRYNDGWRQYEDIPIKTEKINLLYGMKSNLEKQLSKQTEKVSKLSESTRKLDIYNSTPKRRSAANMKLSDECNLRDSIQRRIDIVEKWIKEVENE